MVPLASEAPARLIVDAPHSGQLALDRVVVRYRTENLRILPVYGPAALDVSPRIGHLHITVDEGPWRWVDASGEPIIESPAVMNVDSTNAFAASKLTHVCAVTDVVTDVQVRQRQRADPEGAVVLRPFAPSWYLGTAQSEGGPRRCA